MSNKKLPAALQKLLDQHKQAWQIDETELAKRYAAARINYSRYPIIGDTENYSQIIIYKNTFYEFLKEIKLPKWAEYEIDLSRSTATHGAFKAFLIKPQNIQETDIERIDKEVLAQYKTELEAVKQEYVENLLFEKEQQKLADIETQHKLEQQKLKDSLLDML
ncbi:hypothetical protein [Pseudoalteromonas sp. KAN5]|uniref:hypothetical protein n=1 Tax=Pseudoalteromonas sp. KAN5 TaxID=2916633 RepID=UPI001FCCBFC7|nr:hypothetical protein [Pseudoalteromonas sp. KAN5]BDF96488.1 hypothetical protein KAN5_33260 [Pseudoalteromonas sp. KAN5]